MGNKFTRCLFGREPIGFGQLWVDPGGQISDRFLSVESNDCDAMRKQKGFLGMSNQWIHVNHHVCYRKKIVSFLCWNHVKTMLKDVEGSIFNFHFQSTNIQPININTWHIILRSPGRSLVMYPMEPSRWPWRIWRGWRVRWPSPSTKP